MIVKFRNKITVRLLISFAISLFFSMFISILVSRLFLYYIDLNMIETTPTFASVYITIEFLAIISSFIACFLFLIRKKLKYIKHITESVQQIANGNLGLNIEVIGKDEITQLANNINIMSKELENKFHHEREIEKGKNELITNVSHDLRTPLTSLIGYLDLLKKGEYSPDAKYNEYLEISYSKSQNLKFLIDELFEYTRLSNPKIQLNISEVNMSDLLEQIIGEYIPIFGREKISVQKKIDDEATVLIDIEKVVRVYENLFMNVIKYSVKPSTLQISLNKQEDDVVIKVINQVEESPNKDLNKLFDRFYTGEKGRLSNQGVGLGLAISKRIVEIHHGEIFAEYENGLLIITVKYALKK
ncbi:HAMP domain-containing histidine kinase [Lysinibacillus fusiformis]|uniref:HAMP domain-containing sensor histidine kinase n=1 Tax=Lysinibacillus fusiformis TaxID=28031 RepID=UPI00196878B6|nr:HAMP domain-containing sensor histidine kinase [Lysinibacillus fusiformis]QSB08723.1 HAMP domain-containing histidine kinase [Lysinibacillus fusiformis]